MLKGKITLYKEINDLFEGGIVFNSSNQVLINLLMVPNSLTTLV